MEQNLKDYLSQISNATLEIAQTPAEYLEIINKTIQTVFDLIPAHNCKNTSVPTDS